MAIEVKNLKKHFQVHRKEEGLRGSVKALFSRKFETVKAVDDISFKIKEGELVGFIGPNGAGKTTTLKCLSGLLYPTQGKISVLGFEPWRRKKDYLKQISLVMGQKNQLWWDLPPKETFLLNKEIYEISEKDFKNNLGELVELLEVEDILKIQTRKLSLGQRMKCELIAALLHRPKVLFLDEPTIGLDVMMQRKIRDFIKEYNRKFRASIILTSHYMEDVKELCKRVIIIDEGKLVFDGQLDRVVKKLAKDKLLSIVLTKRIKKEALQKLGQVEIREFNFPKVVLSVERVLVPLVASEALRSLPVEDLNIEEPRIEEIIRRFFTERK